VTLACESRDIIIFDCMLTCDCYLLLFIDVDMDKPDERSIMTYVAKFLEKYPDPDSDFPDVTKV